VVCINMIHITPWAACKGLMTGAERALRWSGVLYLYGPYQINGRHTAQSNRDFDVWLRTQNAQWGVRDLAEVTDLAHRHGFSLAETIPMPANNLSVGAQPLTDGASPLSKRKPVPRDRCGHMLARSFRRPRVDDRSKKAHYTNSYWQEGISDDAPIGDSRRQLAALGQNARRRIPPNLTPPRSSIVFWSVLLQTSQV
jgi:Protein of unknown function (DUF938)